MQPRMVFDMTQAIARKPATPNADPARVQGLSRGGDVVLTDAVRDDAQAAALLAGLSLDSAAATLKGIDGPVHVHRLLATPG